MRNSKTLKNVLNSGTAILKKHNIDNAEHDSFELLSNVINCDRGYYFLHENDTLNSNACEEYMDSIILDVKQGVELNDDKFILTRLKDELKIGEVLKWKKFDWLVVSEETNVDNSHNHHRLKQCNGKIKFTNN